MGSSASKATRAAGASARQYPTRIPTSTNSRPPPPPPPSSPASYPGPNARSSQQTTSSQTPALDPDARDPLLASRLHSLGAVQPNPHYSPSSTSPLDPDRSRTLRQTSPSTSTSANIPQNFPSDPFPHMADNPAIRVLQARQRIQEEAEEEISMTGRKEFVGRKYIDAGIVSLALMRRGKGEADARIEDGLGIATGRLGVLKRGVVDAV
ncbi:hypothetical protein BCR34DRAFT_471520 [Clohesyomyces aquaticus]|uniref:Helix-turn-helix domain-containing protein n=1 Tax=Clohesyomyces aquaticus TaxID=1231657 RepID=A0A1Y2ACV3_9PLEO|nr:hypothetical protein BCR34DRAFT_471520 [Clohesyomyces aquaticus]